MHKADCIDVELCDKCFTLPCECIIVNIKDGIIRGEHLIGTMYPNYSFYLLEIV